jgi:CRP/FNR family transcriptional regulator
MTIGASAAGSRKSPAAQSRRRSDIFWRRKEAGVELMNPFTMLDFTDFFGGLSEKSKLMLSEIASPKALRKGQILFCEGEKGHAVYLLGSGSIQLSKAGPRSKEVVIKVIQPGELFGEVVLFEQDTFPATAAAIRKSTVFVLPKAHFHGLMERASFRNDFIVLLMCKQRYLAERLRHLQTHDVDERFLLFLRENFGTRERIVPGISKKDFAAAIGAAPETFSRLLLRLNREGIATWKGKEIVLRKGFWREFSI